MLRSLFQFTFNAGRKDPEKLMQDSNIFFRQLIVRVLAAALLLTGCAGSPPGSGVAKVVSRALDEPEKTRLGQRFLAAANAQEGKSGFQLVQAGIDGLLIRLQLIAAAEKTLDLQYYIFRADRTGRLLTQAVLLAADRGVRVRLLIDDGDTEPGDEQLAALTHHQQIEVRIFNPFRYRGKSKFVRGLEFATNLRRLDYRMHNKLLVVDNALALVGGRNVANEYFQIDPELRFADEDAIAAGMIVRRLSAYFDDFWNSELSVPASALDAGPGAEGNLKRLRDALTREQSDEDVPWLDFLKRSKAGEPLASILSGARPLVWARAELVADSPEKRQVVSGERFGSLMAPLVVHRASEINEELLIVSPFLIPGPEGMELLGALRSKKASVRVLTNSLESTSEIAAHAGYMRYRVPMLTQGIELYEIRARPGKAKGSGESRESLRWGTFSLHAKLFVFDRKALFVGSMNFDQRSRHLNTEVGLIIESQTLAEQAAKRFEAMTLPENAYRVALKSGAAGREAQLIWVTQEGGRTVAYDVEPAQSEDQRAKAKLLSVIAPEKEL